MKQSLLLLALLFLVASCGDQTKQPAAEAGSAATM
jgi:hypothetical protein